MIDRRHFLTGGAAALGGAAFTLRAHGGPLQVADLAPSGLPWSGLATSLPEEHDYRPVVEGTLPKGLRGSLYRNGPGLFERGGERKRSVLDGDGMLQCFDFGDDGVRFRNRFTRTEKYREEEASGRYSYATWTTRAPGGRLANLFATSMGNQAGVSVYEKQGTLYAFDESSLPHAVDPDTLETRGLSRMGLPEGTSVVFAAHPKTDARTGEWVHFGLAYGRNVKAQITTFDASGRYVGHHEFALPRYTYVHDFFVTENHVVFNLHPAEISIFSFLTGGASLVGAMKWRPELGNQVAILRRDGQGDPVILEADAHWMWHTLNAYERGGEIVADFVGHDDATDFLGDDPALFAIMQGRRGQNSHGRLRRYVLDPAKRTLRLETLSDGNYEFPIVNPARACHENRFGYLARSAADASHPWWTQLVRFDVRSGAEEHYDFGAGRYCAEPIFAADPAATDAGGSADEAGWLLSQVFDANEGKSFLAVLRADRIADGPVALVRLRHHVPLSFHGTWSPA